MFNLVTKIKGSLAYRLPVLYKKLLRFKSKPRLPVKQTSATVVLTMTGKGIIDMTILSVLSIAKSWGSLPKLIITSDGTISAAEIRSKLRFWTGELIINDWQLTETYHQNKDRANLIAHTHKHVLIKKLAVILHYAELQPILWLDSDILFYNNFTSYIPRQQDFICAGSEEDFSLYDDRVLKFFNNDLYQRYKFSSGLMFIHGAHIYETFRLEELFGQLNDYTNYFTEQTIFAHIASQSSGIVWSTDIIKNFTTDNQQLKPMSKSNVIARHYTMNVRHLFWRDAFFNL